MGAVTVAIWQNEGSNGRPIYNATADRLYRDPETGDWKTSSSFGRDDLLLLAKAADTAHTRICELQTLDRATKEKRDGDEPSEQEGAEHEPEDDGAAVAKKARAKAKVAGASR
jgi:hypothetical protein